MERGMEEVMRDRASTYGLLARLFEREIDEKLLAALQDFRVEKEEVSGTAGEGISLMLKYLAEVKDDPRTELAVDFARLFIVRTAKSRGVPYPFESVYTSSEHIMMDDARDDVLAFYRQEGFQKRDSWNLAEDHIALELEFEQMLCERTIDALQKGEGGQVEALLERQHSFLKRHLAVWIDPFVEAMGETARTDFYQGLALFLKGFLEEENNFLEDWVGSK